MIHKIHALVKSNYLPTLLLLITLSGCEHNDKMSVKTIYEGPYIIKASFVNGKRNGKTEVYDSSGKLGGIVNYVDDLKSGICIHYFPNGVVGDSVKYLCDKPQGYWRHYDQEGNPLHYSYYYFGLQYGPDLWYDKGRILKEFDFLDFERQSIVKCTYDSRGQLDSILKVDLTVMLDKRYKNGSEFFDFFSYLPQIPLTNQTYYLGIADKNKVTHKLCDIKEKDFFIDTLLAAPPPGSHYYLECDIKTTDGKYDQKITIDAGKS